ncbi:hypothetical protein LTR86_001088 [Recurvomyces mirabilis]|nr:hypothetical protein LTR86_001088 [Recurvomyces mirabilis]
MPTQKVPIIADAAALVEVLEYVEASSEQVKILQDYLEDHEVSVVLFSQGDNVQDLSREFADAATLREVLRWVVREHKSAGAGAKSSRGSKDVNDLFMRGVTQTLKRDYLQSIGWTAQNPSSDAPRQAAGPMAEDARSPKVLTRRSQFPDFRMLNSSKGLDVPPRPAAPPLAFLKVPSSHGSDYTDKRRSSAAEQHMMPQDRPSPEYSPLTPVLPLSRATQVADQHGRSQVPRSATHVETSSAFVVTNQSALHRPVGVVHGTKRPHSTASTSEEPLPLPGRRLTAARAIKTPKIGMLSSPASNLPDQRNAIEKQLDPSGSLPLPELAPTVLPLPRHERVLDNGGAWVHEKANGGGSEG